MKRLSGVFFALVLFGAACGGESSEEGADDVAEQSTATQPSENNADESTATTSAPDDDDADDSGGEGPSTATVTIGSETYEFSSENAQIAQCLPDLFGTMVLNLPLADGSDGGIEVVALHDGTDPAVVGVTNRVHMSIGDFDWWADPLEINLGPDQVALSAVESVTVNGSSLSGTASFAIRELTTREWTAMTGTFEATCGEERTS